ncbi:DUF6485 family protein [Perlabentimonas gracilis]|uniref:DUF6485 family protein n=1 Tax=Perlabentimonas gracilis TaxID=2715279 RepID=UPI00140C6552|nr:hypothetical protein [Perlabentimonas gracilis]
MDCKKDSNIGRCNCTYPCSRKGVCCDCIAYHRKMGQLPACYFPDDIEKGYDRSIDNFIRIYNERGNFLTN